MKHELEGGWLEVIPTSRVPRVIEDQTEDKTWIDGANSVNAFLQMKKEHPGTTTTKLASKLLVSAILGEGDFPLYRMARFDSQNLEHALNILKAVGTSSADFRSHVERSYRSQFHELSAQE